MNKIIAQVRSLIYPVINYQKSYPGSDVINYSNGEIEQFKMAQYPEDIWIGKRFLGDGRDSKGEYDTIHVYLGGGWFKLISKVY